MNDNVPGDPRDTTSPVAMTNLMRTMMEGKVLSLDLRTQLIRWSVGTTTGTKRIKAGLPEGTLLGHKTGTCGTAWNDIGFFRQKVGMGHGANAYYLSVYIDRPTAPDAKVEAAIADIGKLAFDMASIAEAKGEKDYAR
jgi:beta-lactamase class A